MAESRSRHIVTPAGPGEAELTEKRSTFLGHVRPVHTEAEARAFITEMKKKYHDARHNCWCYLLQDGPERYSDDGEPQGTAGVPMLEVFRREGVTNAVCVVTRYFGGILLGAGGLLRAYTRSASDALQAAGRRQVRTWAVCSLRCSYAALETVKRAVTVGGGTLENIAYGSEVTLCLLVPEEDFDTFAENLFQQSSGTLRVKKESSRAG